MGRKGILKRRDFLKAVGPAAAAAAAPRFASAREAQTDRRP